MPTESPPDASYQRRSVSRSSLLSTCVSLDVALTSFENFLDSSRTIFALLLPFRRLNLSLLLVRSTGTLDQRPIRLSSIPPPPPPPFPFPSSNSDPHALNPSPAQPHSSPSISTPSFPETHHLSSDPTVMSPAPQHLRLFPSPLLLLMTSHQAR